MFLVGIAGGSGSGKTTFAKKVMQRLSDPNVALLHQDSYYLATPPTQYRVHGEPNFDHPLAFDWPLLTEHLRSLKNGEQVMVPVYDFRTSRRTNESTPVGPCHTILIEGLYTLWDPEIRNIFDLKIYINVDADIRFIRRLHRDVRERGRTLDSIVRQYYDTVRPMHAEFLSPTRQFADLVVGEESDIAADAVAARIAQFIAQNQGKLPPKEKIQTDAGDHPKSWLKEGAALLQQQEDRGL